MLKKLWNFIGEILFPTFCCSCHTLGRPICFKCYERLEFFSQPVLLHLEPLYLDQVIAAVEYKEPISKLIHLLKYEAGRNLGHYCGDFLYQTTNFPQTECITAVPLHRKRLSTRGYNQAELIAQRISQLTKIPYHSLLQRITFSRPQATILNKKARIANLDSAFRLHPLCRSPTFSFPSSVLLIDDVTTTGTTLNECAKVLKAAGVRAVIGLAVAHGK